MPGMDDVLVLMGTGVTEALEKLPIHLETTLRCVPHYAVFSDFEEEIAGVRTHDVLRSLSDEVKNHDPDFELYNRVQQSGRDGLKPSDFMVDDISGPSGKPNNPGWKLDKWKFLPMIDEALALRPEAKWYLFMEADTYMVLPNVGHWLQQFDHTKPYYLGTQMMLGDLVFAYGGAGFFLSNAAMRQFSEYRSTRLAELDKFTASQWAGDAVLGKVLADAGVHLTFSWPMLQTARIWELDHFGKPWCSPVLSYHHMTAGDIDIMWRFDRQWHKNNTDSPLLHSNVFNELILPGLSSERDNWDNFSKDNQDASSQEDCKQKCVSDSTCLQYSFRLGKCFTAKTAHKGAAKEGFKSGWVADRIRKEALKLGSCTTPEWVH
ncbi:hypothetical protein LOZ53_002852 [Ophidiomyces ophidiicola]|uniref:Uncharacterized protein n=1 Tax=Ophidiomyces ophidiicola TaxID=1387563 RepID=A0ACB8UNG6_9EURO|nr:uncharacterized protein LOZ57_003974 [Ophidiomyces ophidiicola]KAI1916673.1 hypothetical protein LOZ61_000942 [Ophidiomyces ophidiicola]KAI1918414.1 hypothetical protein LOZ64_002819 [Ophidiomyces ophidiicola]KAI1920202.1 hypothetical protein LOZ60_006632 [Ophidiomyces ophidiicola]KAI1945724.1 hypothetical protein LOZ57_003974 [Ophidiomyces ophidiicola]KAI1950642.1 hypothetical protein LOZ62_001906 [Ophidiomyces ophidiicola]